MQTAQGNMLESLHSVRDFIDQHADRLQGVISPGTRTALLQAIADLDAFSNMQTVGRGAAKGSTKRLRELRRTLVRDHMAPVTRIAKATLPHTPELAALKMPRGAPSDAKLASDAYEMANAVADNAQPFLALGLPATFVAELKAAADALAAERNVRANSLVTRVTATKGLAARLSAGRKLVHVMDALVAKELKFEPALLAGWRQARRVSRVTGFPAHSGSAVPAPAPAPAPTSAHAA